MQTGDNEACLLRPGVLISHFYTPGGMRTSSQKITLERNTIAYSIGFGYVAWFLAQSSWGLVLTWTEREIRCIFTDPVERRIGEGKQWEKLKTRRESFQRTGRKIHGDILRFRNKVKLFFFLKEKKNLRFSCSAILIFFHQTFSSD